MSDIVCVTARKLCRGDFFDQLTKIAKASPKFIILREKDLSENEYKKLAVTAMDICSEAGCELILHYYWNAAVELEMKNIHLPLSLLKELSADDKEKFTRIGTSCHSVSDALEAKQLGADYITAGHVFATDCKKGLAPRGLDFLRDVCYSVDIPVYAIGGISPDNIASVRECGAAGACAMSGFMQCSDPLAYIDEFNRK